MNINPLKVLIVGCGNIAGKFDESIAPNDFPMTHAGAFFRDKRFNLAGCIEPNLDRRKEFSKKWNILKSFESFIRMPNLEGEFDIISICSPTACHGDDVKNALSLKPKLIFCEKPVTISADQTKKISDMCQDAGVLLCINYSRRWDPDIHKLKSIIENKLLGKLRSVSGVYNKGLLNNGSHMIDLLNFLFGKVDIVKTGKSIKDYSENDPSVPVWLIDKNGLQINLSCGNANDFSIFEIQFIFEAGILTMEDGGLSWRERNVIPSTIYNGFNILNDGIYRDGRYNQSMTLAINNIWDAINNNTKLFSDGNSALESHVICDKIFYNSRRFND